MINNVNGFLVNENDYDLFVKKIIYSKSLDLEKNSDLIKNKINFYDLKLNIEKIILSYRNLL